jgi:AraC-like DNA-binding protein
MQRSIRRRVDWRVTTGDDPSRARLASPSTQHAGLAHLTSALLADPSPATVDRILREAVEFARQGLRLERAAIYLIGPDRQAMVGTWGTDARGQTTDERGLGFAIDDLVRQFFARSARGYAWSVYEDCPMVTHEHGRTRVLGRGWLACTAILGREQPIGVLFNDTAISHAPLDESKQARVAVLCSLLGRALDTCRERLFATSAKDLVARSPLVRAAIDLLAADPSLSCQEVARRLGVSKEHLTRVFKRHADASIVDYRNELRLAQFLGQTGDRSLLDAALGAGFGSYAQFHRVFRARFGKTPRDYLGEHKNANAAHAK